MGGGSLPCSFNVTIQTTYRLLVYYCARDDRRRGFPVVAVDTVVSIGSSSSNTRISSNGVSV